MLRTIWAGLIIVPWTAICATLSFFGGIFVPQGRGYHQMARLWSAVILPVIGIRLKVTGLEHLDPSQQYVFVSNHSSAIDIPVVVHSIPWQIRLVAKKELAWVPFLGWSLVWGDYLLIDRKNRSNSKKSLDAAASKLKNGRSIFMFAEGTRSRDGSIGPFKSGPFLVAIWAQVPVVPITINFTHTIMEKNSLRVRGGVVEVHISPPIPTIGKTESDRKEIVDSARNAVTRHHQLTR